MKEYKIFSKWLAKGLRKQGFKQIRVEPNRYNPALSVWVFENNTDLQIAILCLTEDKNEWRARG